MRLSDLSIRRPVLATVMISVFLVFGLVAYPKIGVDLFPEVEFPIVTVTAVYPGADPETMESKVVEKLEEAVSSINGIKTLRSTSSENVGMVMMQFELERKVDQVLQDVRDKVNASLANLPADLEPPVIQKFDVGAAPVLTITLSGSLPIGEISRVAEDVLKDRIQAITGVGGVDIVGKQDREFHIWVDPQRLETYRLGVADVSQALATQNVEIPGGRVDVGIYEYAVKTQGQVKSREELANIIIADRGNGPVRVRDVARVEDGVEEKRTHSSFNGQSAVALVVRKQSGANQVEVARKVKALVDTLAPTLPSGLTVAVPSDNSRFILNTISSVQFDLVLGAILTVLIIMLFLRDWRATLISAVALPTSVIATFGLMQAMGFTFNNMTMLALTLSIGILIDDAIVVIENIHRHLQMGKSAIRAAREGSAEIGLAVLATTASILAVFVPVATMKGIVGRFFFQFGMTVAFAVAISYLVAFTLTPTFSARLLKAEHGQPKGLSKAIDGILTKIDRAYGRTLETALAHKGLTVVAALFVFIGSMVLAGMVPSEFIPKEDRSEFKVVLELPVGTGLAKTQEATEATAQDLIGLPGVMSVLVSVGANSELAVNRAELNVQLVPRKERQFSQKEAMEFVRNMLNQRGDANYAVEMIEAVGGSGGFRAANVQFNLRGSDYDELNMAGAKIAGFLKERGGYVDIDTTYRGGKPEVRLDVDRDRAAKLGVPMAALASTIRTLYAGDKATEIPIDGERYDVRVRLDSEFRKDLGTISEIKVRGMTGELVPLSNFTSVVPGEGAAKIERQSRMRQVTVLANLTGGKTLGTAVEEITAYAKAELPPTLTTDFAGQAEVMGESFGYMFEAILIAIVLLFLILAAQFESFVHPFTILLSVPLSVAGAFGALLLTGMTLNLFTMIGFIMLMGLVTKNAILLVDYTNHLRAEGMEREAALLKAGPVRLRPILMTTAAMVGGMMPVALGMGEGGEIRAPMAVAVIGGLITSTALTLVVVPVVYSLFDRVLARSKKSSAAALHEAMG